MPRRKGRRRRGRSRAASGYHVGDEFITFSCKLGASQDIKVQNLSTLPKNCNFRIVWIKVTASQPLVPGPANDQTSGYFTAGGLDLVIYDNNNVIITSSKPQVLGANPRSVWVRSPPGKAYFPYNMAGSAVIGQLSALCFGKPSLYTDTGYIRGLIQIRFSFSYEILSSTCPTLQHLCDTDPDGDDASSAYEVIDGEGLAQGLCASLPLPGSTAGPSTSTPPHLLGISVGRTAYKCQPGGRSFSSDR